jgi:hypothetical protein
MIMTDTVFIRGVANRDLPALRSEGEATDVRLSRRGELISHSLWGSRLHGLANEGSLFVATNPTPGTAIAGIAAATTLDDLAALIFLRLSSSSTKRLYLLDLELQVAAAGASGTNWAYAINGDKNTSRYASGGSAITPRNANMASSVATEIDRLQFGAVVCTAASSEKRLLDHGLVQTVIKVVGSKYRFVFGDSSTGTASGIPLEGTTQHSQVIHCPPVVLGAGDSFVFHEFAASQSGAASYQFKMRWIER